MVGVTLILVDAQDELLARFFGHRVEMAKTPASQAGDCEFDPRRHHQYVPVVKWYHSSLLSCQIRVRIPSGAPYASLAQLEEQPALNRQVLGSNPRRRTICTDGGTGRHAGLRTLWPEQGSCEFESRSVHQYAQVVELEYTPVSDTGPSGAAGSTPALCTIWAGSESANATDCKSVPFGGSGLDTHSAHQKHRA